MAYLVPVCKRCGQPHYNFKSCAEAGAERPPEQRPAGQRFLRPRDGHREFGNRTHTYQARGQVAFIPRDQHPCYRAPLRLVTEAKEIAYPRFYEGDDAA